ncbi:MAG: 4'-phosphopantetheinyl transferase superfamily protein [Deltaproteobacteria bacterium]|nr:4'-phosphopantetheinyl transferase superfamily protein [Deltaproteobacteria bacterium]
MRQEWTLRFWCAKEAAGKIIGSGIIGQAGNIRIEERGIESGKRLSIRDCGRRGLKIDLSLVN